MALLDVSEIIADPDFSDDITIIRSTETVDITGRGQISPGTYFTYGSVQPYSGIDLQIIPDGERSSSYIKVVTPFHLYSLTDQTAPDQVVWGGAVYRVILVKDWSAYGNGFVEALCALEGFTEAVAP